MEECLETPGGPWSWPVSIRRVGMCFSEGAFPTSRDRGVLLGEHIPGLQVSGAPSVHGRAFFLRPAFSRLHVASGKNGVAADVAWYRQQIGEFGCALSQVRRLQVDIERLTGSPLLDESEFERIRLILQQHIGDASGFFAGGLDETGNNFADCRGRLRPGGEMSDNMNWHALILPDFLACRGALQS